MNFPASYLSICCLCALYSSKTICLIPASSSYSRIDSTAIMKMHPTMKDIVYTRVTWGVNTATCNKACSGRTPQIPYPIPPITLDITKRNELSSVLALGLTTAFFLLLTAFNTFVLSLNISLFVFTLSGYASLLLLLYWSGVSTTGLSDSFSNILLFFFGSMIPFIRLKIMRKARKGSELIESF